MIIQQNSTGVFQISVLLQTFFIIDELVFVKLLTKESLEAKIRKGIDIPSARKCGSDGVHFFLFGFGSLVNGDDLEILAFAGSHIKPEKIYEAGASYARALLAKPIDNA